jgi:hypothetical protein
MTELDPALAVMIASTTGVGILMVLSGMQKRSLEWRNRRRTCPSCGRAIVGRRCNAH